MSACPFCAEEIQGSPAECPHCGSQIARQQRKMPKIVWPKIVWSRKYTKIAIALAVIGFLAISALMILPPLFASEAEKFLHFQMDLLGSSEGCLVGDDFCYVETDEGQWKIQRNIFDADDYVSIPPRGNVLVSPREGDWENVTGKGRECTEIFSNKNVVPCQEGFGCVTSAVVMDGELISVNLSYNSVAKYSSSIAPMTNAAIALEKENWDSIPNLGRVASTKISKEIEFLEYSFIGNTHVTFNEHEMWGSGKHVVHDESGKKEYLREIIVNFYWIKRTADTEELFKRYEKIISEREKEQEAAPSTSDHTTGDNVPKEQPVKETTSGAENDVEVAPEPEPQPEPEPTPEPQEEAVAPEPVPEPEPEQPAPLTMPSIAGVPDITTYDYGPVQKDDAKAANKSGMKAYKAKNYPMAIAKFIEALEANSSAHMTRFNLGCTYALNGDAEKALDILQQLKIKGCEKCLKFLEKSKTDSDFDSVRGTPRYQRIMEE